MQKITLVVPAYNEASRMDLDAFRMMLGEDPYLSFCFVNDASTDATHDIISGFMLQNRDRVALIDLPVNDGKAEAVRAGMIHAAGMQKDGWIGFWDADLAVPLSQLRLFRKAFQENPEVQFLFGSRIKRLGAKINRRPVRHLMGRAFATVVGILIEEKVYDSQCGAKLFRAEHVSELFGEAFVTRWIFDVEILARIMLSGRGRSPGRPALEIPLTVWEEKRGSKIKVTDLLKVPVEICKIYKKYFLNGK